MLIRNKHCTSWETSYLKGMKWISLRKVIGNFLNKVIFCVLKIYLWILFSSKESWSKIHEIFLWGKRWLYQLLYNITKLSLLQYYKPEKQQNYSEKKDCSFISQRQHLRIKTKKYFFKNQKRKIAFLTFPIKVDILN